jgi:hypothetical protein
LSSRLQNQYGSSYNNFEESSKNNLRWEILNPLIPRTPKIGCETSEKKAIFRERLFQTDSEFPSASFFDKFTCEIAFWKKMEDELRKTKKSTLFFDDCSK